MMSMATTTANSSSSGSNYYIQGQGGQSQGQVQDRGTGRGTGAGRMAAGIFPSSVLDNNFIPSQVHVQQQQYGTTAGTGGGGGRRPIESQMGGPSSSSSSYRTMPMQLQTPSATFLQSLSTPITISAYPENTGRIPHSRRNRPGWNSSNSGSGGSRIGYENDGAGGTGPPQAKTPMALLNELVARGFTTPEYEIHEDGPVHSRIYQVVIRTSCPQTGKAWEGQGTGKTKKDAKQDAAKNLLLQIDSRLESLMLITTPSSPPQSVAPVVAVAPEPAAAPPAVDPEIEGNPIGELNDVCMRIKISGPEYEEILPETPAPQHAQIFIFKCIVGGLVGGLSETGSGQNKKKAKRVAANNVLQKLLAVLRSPASAAEYFPEGTGDEVRRKLLQFVEGQATKIAATAKRVSGKVEFLQSIGAAASAVPTVIASKEEIFNLMQSWSGEKLDELLAFTPPDFQKSNILQLFENISSEHKLETEFFDVPPCQAPGQKHNSLDKKIRSFLTISSGTNPSGTGTNWSLSFYGVGNNVEVARRSCAYQFLDFLRCAGQIGSLK